MTVIFHNHRLQVPCHIWQSATARAVSSCPRDYLLGPGKGPYSLKRDLNYGPCFLGGSYSCYDGCKDSELGPVLGDHRI